MPEACTRAGATAAWRTCAAQADSSTVYGGPQAPLPAQVTLRVLQQKYAAKEPISMVTAYDYPSAVHVRPGRACRALRQSARVRRVALRAALRSRFSGWDSCQGLCRSMRQA